MRLIPKDILYGMTKRYPELEICSEAIQSAFKVLYDSFKSGGKLMLCGNGGSAADCEHIVGELMKGFMLKRPVPMYFAEHTALEGEGMRLQGALPALSLTGHPALSTAFANDVDPNMVFAQLTYGYGRANDILMGISTSGNSENICRALRVARAMGIKTLGLTGRSGGHMLKLCDIIICVPADETYMVQEYHLPVYHTLCAMLEAAFFEE